MWHRAPSRRLHPSLPVSDRPRRRISKTLAITVCPGVKSTPMKILLTVALASAVAFAQSGQRKPFDPHDLSGFWDLTNIGLPRGALNETSNNRPPMTQWALEKFRKTKTGDANALTNGAYSNQKDWNDPIRWCDPTGFPRIMWNPTPAGMRFAQTNEEVIQFFQNNRVWRDIWTDGRKLPDA